MDKCTRCGDIKPNGYGEGLYGTVCYKCVVPMQAEMRAATIAEMKAKREAQGIKIDPTRKPYCGNCGTTLVHGDCPQCERDNS